MCTIWVTVPGYEGLYEVSSDGRVRSLPRDIVSWKGRWRTDIYEMKQRPGNEYGHASVSLTDAQGRTRKKWVHRLVAIAHIPNPEGHPYVLHGPAGKANNSVENLRWGTAQQNSDDVKAHGTQPVYVPMTHCRHGHEFTPENTYIAPSRPRERMCRECMRTRSRERGRALSKAGVRRRPVVVLQPRACAECRIDFTPRRRSDAVFCSAACKSKAHRRKKTGEA